MHKPLLPILLVCHLATRAQVPFALSFDRPGEQGLLNAREAANGDILALGYHTLNNAGGIFLLRTNANGDTLWTRVHSSSSAYYMPRAFALTDNGGTLTTGCSVVNQDYRMFIMATDAQGDTVSMTTIDSLQWICGTAVERISDGAFLVVGEAFPDPAAWNVFLLKIDTSGAVLWSRSLVFPGSEVVYDIKELPDGGFLLTGIIAQNAPASAWVHCVRTDALGIPLWTRSYPTTEYAQGNAALPLADDGAWIVGSVGPGSARDAIVLRIDANGDELQRFTFDMNRTDCQANDIFPCPGGGFGVLWEATDGTPTTTGINFYNADGLFQYSTVWGQTMDHTWFKRATVAADGAVLLAGGYSPYPMVPITNARSYLVRTPIADCTVNGVSDPSLLGTHLAHPMPFTDALTVQWQGEAPDALLVFDALGQLVRVLPVGGQRTVIWDGRNAMGAVVPSGTYLIRSDRGTSTVVVKG